MTASPSPQSHVASVARPAVRIGAAIVGIGAAGLLSGCTAIASAGDDSNQAAVSEQSSSVASTASAGTAYKDGRYKETGDYQTPGGTESVNVTLTIKDGTVAAVTVTGSERTLNSKQYQSQFESGISSVVVGKKLATLEVGAVSGSSLTPNGFNQAVAKIRADAAE